MEVVGGGLSVLTFIGLAAQSAKTRYELFSAFKDDPQEVERVATHVPIYSSHFSSSYLGVASSARAHLGSYSISEIMLKSATTK